MIEVVIAIIAVAKFPKYWEEKRVERLKHLAESFAIVTAAIVLVVLVSNRRINSLQEARQEREFKKSQEASTQAQSAARDAQTSADKAKVLLDKQKPKPFDDRLRAFLDKLSPSILLDLKSGKATTFKGTLSDPLLNELDTLCAEPEASKYIKLLKPEEYIKGGDSLGGMGFPGGAFSTAAFILSTNLIK
ncbi:MAG TPA: hypothetical protein VN765_13860 [Candidatus Acidoferrum sp.]|nr:hypothetical protein [Candidatus Acidoferrum sp.]